MKILTSFTVIFFICIILATTILSSSVSAHSRSNVLSSVQKKNGENDLLEMRPTSNKGISYTPQGRANKAALESQFKSFRENFFDKVTGLYKEDHTRANPNKIHVSAIFSDWQNTTGYVNVLDFGADPTGKSDNTNAFHAAIAAGANGKVFVPAGSYLFSASGEGIQVPAFTTLAGVNSQAFSAWEGGTTIIISGPPPSSNMPFIRLQGPDAGVEGMSIFYTAQQATSATPVVFPPCIQGNGDNMYVAHMLLVNPYIGIDFATHPCGRHRIYNVYGQPLSVGIKIDQVYDIGRVSVIHFWPFFAAYIPNNKLNNYIMQNAVTFLILRTDWQIFTDVFSWGYHRGIVFAQDPTTNGAHSCNGQFTNINFDDVNVGVEISATQPPGVFFSNLNLANAGNGPTPVAVSCPSNSTANVQADIRGLSVWGQFKSAVEWDCGGKLGLSDFIINNWARGGTAININGGRVNIRGGYFADTIGNSIIVGGSVDRAIVSENDLVGNPMQCNNKDNMCSNNLA